MDHWKKNSSLRYFAGLALLMVPVILMIIASPAFARYQEEKIGNITFNVKEPGQICFAKIENATLYVIENPEGFVWTVPEDKTTRSLELTVANGSGNSDFSKYDQNVTVMLVAGLGLSVDEDGETGITLEHEGNIYSAKAEKTMPGSESYTAFGEGWVITFFDKARNEFSGVLEGGKLDTFTVKITVENASINENTVISPFAKIIN
ncbi:MAG: hypothetical protein IJE28_03265 [Oscillospiraceae bacterium]|nr:hypothetical protein [Oscillospiraceae bacterium]MBQ4642864.1 hypothetical protein [Oscillospiraceae bacterium]